MVLLIDVGNTHVHLGLGNAAGVFRTKDIPTHAVSEAALSLSLKDFVSSFSLKGAVLASVVPARTLAIIGAVQSLWKVEVIQLSASTIRGVGITYPKPETIGADRLANAIAVRHHYGAPAVAIDFGTAVTFDVVDQEGNYAGGIIAPGLAALTDYLHEKTALLPRVTIREVATAIGKSTEEAMLIGAVHGYRGLIRELLLRLSEEMQQPELKVVATGGYAHLIAGKMPEIRSVAPNLTLEGLRLLWNFHHAAPPGSAPGGTN
jgi:type III pantothenate kinase